MIPRGRIIGAIATLALGLGAVSACLLTTSLDGLSGGASADAAAVDGVPVDGAVADRTGSGSDGSASDARADASDVGIPPDAAPSAVLVGDDTIEATTDNVAGGQPEAFTYVALASGTATKLVVFLDLSTTASQMKIGIYSDMGQKPAQLLGEGALDNSMLGMWNTVPISPVAIEIGKRYWIAVLAVGAATDLFAFRSTKFGAFSYQSQTAGLASLAPTYGAVNAYNNSPMSAYAAP